MTEPIWQPIAGRYRIAVSPAHRYGTDALLLAHFAAPHRGDRVLDLGTGCGVIPLRLCATGLPGSVHGIDIAPQAVALAQRSAAAMAAQGGCPVPTFAVGDWTQPATLGQDNRYDLITCNPPYFAPGSGALSAAAADRRSRHEQPGTLPAVCHAAARLLHPGGRFCLCHRPQRLVAVLAALTAAGLEPKRLQPVQARTDTAPWLFLLEARLGGRPGMDWLPPLLPDEPAFQAILYAENEGD